MAANLAELQKTVLALPPTERADLVLALWESLEVEAGFDPDGLALAQARDAAMESGAALPLTHAEFLDLTGGGGA